MFISIQQRERGRFKRTDKPKGGGGSDKFAYIWLSGFILRLTVKVILGKS